MTLIGAFSWRELYRSLSSSKLKSPAMSALVWDKENGSKEWTSWISSANKKRAPWRIAGKALSM